MAKQAKAPKGAKAASDSSLLDKVTTLTFVLFFASLVLSRALSG
jgi:hypothetical protein